MVSVERKNACRLANFVRQHGNDCEIVAGDKELRIATWAKRRGETEFSLVWEHVPATLDAVKQLLGY